MSTLDPATLWSATSLASDETKIGAAGLSVRQRKLLALLSQPTSVADLAQRIALPIDDVRTALRRFAKLGLARSAEERSFNPMETRLRSQGLTPPASRLPLTLGFAIAALVAVGAGAWVLRGGTTAAPAAMSKNNSSEATAAAAMSPGDTADSAKSSSFVRSDSAAAGGATLPSPAPVRAPATVATTPAITASLTAARPATVASPVAQSVTVVAASAAAPASPAALSPVTISAPTPTTTPAPAPLPLLALATTLPAVTPASTDTTPISAAATTTPAPIAPAAIAVTTAAPQTVAATSATLTARAAAPRELKLINRVEPAFPRGYEADKGVVRARLQVDARGAVTAVDIVEANPPRVFDRTVRTALQQWRYEPTGEAFTVVAEINFVR